MTQCTPPDLACIFGGPERQRVVFLASHGVPSPFPYARRVAAQHDVFLLETGAPGTERYEIIDGVKIERVRPAWGEDRGHRLDAIRHRWPRLAPLVNLLWKTEFEHVSLDFSDRVMLLDASFYRPDIVHVCGLRSLPAGWGLKRMLESLLVCDMSEQCNVNHRATWIRRRFLQQRMEMLREVDHLLVSDSVTAEVMVEHAGLRGDRVLWTRPKADGEVACEVEGPDNGPVVLYEGHLGPDRNLEHLVQAVADRREWKLVMVGDGPWAARLDEQARGSGAGDRVVLVRSWSPALLWAWRKRAALGIIPHSAVTGGRLERLLRRRVAEWRRAGLPILVADDLHRALGSVPSLPLSQVKGEFELCDGLAVVAVEAIGDALAGARRPAARSALSEDLQSDAQWEDFYAGL